jgi:DNA polymerase-4
MRVACFLLPHLPIATERARLPHLWGQPLALVAPDGTLACVSEEAGLWGVAGGQTADGARRLCRNLVTLPYDRLTYEAAARCVWDALAIESSVVEPVAPEVCYVAMEGRSILARLRHLAAGIAAGTRTNAQVGLGNSKLTAYHAARQDREGKVYIVPPGEESMLLAPLPLHAIPRLDARLVKRLQRLGLSTLGELAVVPPTELRRQIGSRALLIERLVQGRDNDPVKPAWPPPALNMEIRFEWEVASVFPIYEALDVLAEQTARALLRRREFCRTLTLRIEMADRCFLEVSERLIDPSDEAAGLRRAARRLLGRIQGRIDRPLVAVGLRASELGIGGAVQLELLDLYGNGLPHIRRRRLDATLAHLRERFGVGAVVSLSLLQQARRIHLWTYPLGHLLDEPVQVATTSRGCPARFWRRHTAYEVRHIRQFWCETDWVWDEPIERQAYRCETDPMGLYELHRTGRSWRLAALAD